MKLDPNAPVFVSHLEPDINGILRQSSALPVRAYIAVAVLQSLVSRTNYNDAPKYHAEISLKYADEFVKQYNKGAK